MTSKSVADLPAVLRIPRTDPIYNCHGYLTKVPMGAITPFIRAFTKPGDTVLDMFAGSGMTGLAARSVGRHAELVDISVLGQHIAQSYLAIAHGDKLLHQAKESVASASSAIGDLYQAERATDGKRIEFSRTIWSFSFICKYCDANFVYYEHMNPEKNRPPERCPECGKPFDRRSSLRGPDAPVVVVLPGENGKLVEQPVTSGDLERIRRAYNDERQCFVPSKDIAEDREMYRRSALGKHGLTRTKDFFSARNALALYELWRVISEIEDVNLRKKFQFAFTGILGRASRRYQWSAKRPLNAQNQTYYIAPVYFEWNVFDLFLRKVRAVVRSDSALSGSRNLFDTDQVEVRYSVCSSTSLSHIQNESIDYVFTDPPFGSNIFYSDMNLFQEAWLGRVTDHEQEAVIHTDAKRKKNADERYKKILRKSFSEAHRVLRSGGAMSVIFGNSDGRIWTLVQQALGDAGFDPTPEHVAILDKGQRSVKGLVSGSEGVLTVDLVMTFRKLRKGVKPKGDCYDESVPTGELVQAALDTLTVDQAHNPSYVYAATVREALGKRQRLDGLRLGDVLVALKTVGYSVNAKTGLLNAPAKANAFPWRGICDE